MKIPYEVTPRPDTGLFNAKIGIWLFLASEVMLFGGLFSSYIFLRVGADYFWPVHELNVYFGFFNTLVLIFSSVTVVMAWASLKMRNFKQYKICMWLTVACAAIFMVNKGFEYSAKFSHYGVKLQDGTILTGHFPEGGYHIQFGEAAKFTLTAKTGDPDYFLKWATPANPKFKTPSGAEFELTGSMWSGLVEAARNAKQKSIVLTAAAPVSFSVKESALFGYTASSLTFRDGTVVEGRLLNDKMTLVVDGIDVRSVADPLKSIAFDEHYLGASWKKHMEEQHHEAVEAGKKDGRDERWFKDARFLTEAWFLKNKKIAELMHGGGHGDAKSAGGHKAEATEPKESGHGSGGHDHPEVILEKKDIAFWSNFTPKWNTYYAIYFTLTGLHGLHVVAGALVLAYFVMFDGRRMKEDPEHLANRVEVGGLFWHFVDLVWIFLFPLLYLL